jgi:alpha-glucosidase/alpha-D-xyloside xylohydrolase
MNDGLVNVWVPRVESRLKKPRFAMRTARSIFLALAGLACVSRLCAGAGTNAPVLWAGAACEVSLGQISERTAQLVIAPLDGQGDPRPVPTSEAFVAFPISEKFRGREIVGAKEVQVGKMRFVIKAQPLTISVHRSDGSLLQELVLEEATSGAMSFNIDAPVYGLGEGEHQFDRRGTNYEMINGQHGWPGLLATHGATIPVPFLIGADGWSMFVRGPWGQFDLRGQHGLFVPRKTALGQEPLTIYISEVDQPADALAEYIRLTGRPVMPAKWVMGYMQSHRTLLGPDDAVQIAQEFREKNLPCDAVIYLGTGYCPLGWNLGHGSLEFNTNSFPHPGEQIKALHDLNLKVVLHINAAPRNLFGSTMTEESASPFYIGNYWKRHLADMALGVDGWWPDDGDELPIEARLARHLCYYEGPLQARPNTRPWSLNRNGYAGASRYGGWIWSGDTQSRWATLAAHVPVGLNSSLSLTPFWGSDIGGFVPTRELTGELYARWFEFGAFNPLFRSHGRTWHLRLPWGWNTGEMGPIEDRDVVDRGELHNDKIEPICRRYLELRYRLLPYNYTLMRESFDRGLPAMRALWLHYPRTPRPPNLAMNTFGAATCSLRRWWKKAPTTAIFICPQGCGTIGGPAREWKGGNGWIARWIWPSCPFTPAREPLSRWIRCANTRANWSTRRPPSESIREATGISLCTMTTAKAWAIAMARMPAPFGFTSTGTTKRKH